MADPALMVGEVRHNTAIRDGFDHKVRWYYLVYYKGLYESKPFDYCVTGIAAGKMF